VTTEAVAVTQQLSATPAGGSAAVLEHYEQSVMNTFGPPKRVFVRGEGPHVWDADGRKHLDLLSGLAVTALGHAHPTVLAAITGQIATLGHVSNFFATPAQVALAERLFVIDAGAVVQTGPVREVLRAPASAFVASIADMNRMPGVAARGGWTDSDGHLLTSSDVASTALATADGTALAAVFRPSDARVVAGEGANTWKATVLRVEPTLSGSRIHTSAGAVDVGDTRDAWSSGDTVWLHVDLSRVRFVPLP
jgi:hypothetical protein